MKEKFLKEKELLLNSIKKNTSEHWKNYYKNVPTECIYDDLVIDINEIKRLQEENERLKNALKAKMYCKYARNCDELSDCTREEYNSMCEKNMELCVENDQIKNNWYYLKIWLEKNWQESQDVWYVKIINKMRELEKRESE